MMGFMNYEDELLLPPKRYKLNTLVELPHKKKVHALKFRASSKLDDRSPMAVTASSDGTFKIWALADDTDIYRANQCWECESVGFYRDQTPGPIDICEDGTLLVVAFDACLTFWNPDTNALQNTLTMCRNTSNIRHVLFGAGMCSHYVMATTADRLYTWNLLTCAVSWSVALPVSVLLLCPGADRFAVATEHNELHVYSPKSSEPVWTKKLPVKSAVKCAIFLPLKSEKYEKDADTEVLPWQPMAELYYMNENQELVTLDIEKDEEIVHTTTVLMQSVPETPISILLSDKRKVGHLRKGPEIIEMEKNKPGDAFLKEVLGTPAHVLPPVSTLSMNFMDTLLKNSKRSRQSQADDDDTDESDDDDAPVNINSAEIDSDSDDEVSNSKSLGQSTDLVMDEKISEKKFIEARHSEYKKYAGNTHASEVFNWLSS